MSFLVTLHFVWQHCQKYTFVLVSLWLSTPAKRRLLSRGGQITTRSQREKKSEILFVFDTNVGRMVTDWLPIDGHFEVNNVKQPLGHTLVAKLYPLHKYSP